MKGKLLAVAVLALFMVATPAEAVGPGPVHDCGAFVSYRPANATRSGELIIGSTTYAAAWMGSTGPAGSTPHTFRQVIASGVNAGSQVCLDGTLVASQTEANLLTDFTVGPVAPTSLPSTSSQQPSLLDPAIVGLLLVLAAVLGAGLLRRNRREETT
jgi:hypothetical protein